MNTVMTKNNTKAKKKKSNIVDPKNRPHSVGVLVPSGGAYKPTTYCEYHKHWHEGKVCPICDFNEGE